MALGRNKLGLVALAGYISLILTKSIPWVQLGFVDNKGVARADSNIQVFIFLAIIIAIFLLAPHSGLGAVLKSSGRGGRGGWWQIFILGVAELGFLVSAVFSFLPKETVVDLGTLATQFFWNDLPRFIWLLLPLLAMLALKKRRTYNYTDEE